MNILIRGFFAITSSWLYGFTSSTIDPTVAGLSPAVLWICQNLILGYCSLGALNVGLLFFLGYQKTRSGFGTIIIENLIIAFSLVCLTIVLLGWLNDSSLIFGLIFGAFFGFSVIGCLLFLYQDRKKQLVYA